MHNALARKLVHSLRDLNGKLKLLWLLNGLKFAARRAGLTRYTYKRRDFS